MTNSPTDTWAQLSPRYDRAFPHDCRALWRAHLHHSAQMPSRTWPSTRSTPSDRVFYLPLTARAVTPVKTFHTNWPRTFWTFTTQDYSKISTTGDRSTHRRCPSPKRTSTTSSRRTSMPPSTGTWAFHPGPTSPSTFRVTTRSPMTTVPKNFSANTARRVLPNTSSCQCIPNTRTSTRPTHSSSVGDASKQPMARITWSTQDHGSTPPRNPRGPRPTQCLTWTSWPTDHGPCRPSTRTTTTTSCRTFGSQPYPTKPKSTMKPPSNTFGTTTFAGGDVPLWCASPTKADTSHRMPTSFKHWPIVSGKTGPAKTATTTSFIPSPSPMPKPSANSNKSSQTCPRRKCDSEYSRPSTLFPNMPLPASSNSITPSDRPSSPPSSSGKHPASEPASPALTLSSMNSFTPTRTTRSSSSSGQWSSPPSITTSFVATPSAWKWSYPITGPPMSSPASAPKAITYAQLASPTTDHGPTETTRGTRSFDPNNVWSSRPSASPNPWVRWLPRASYTVTDQTCTTSCTSWNGQRPPPMNFSKTWRCTQPTCSRSTTKPPIASPFSTRRSKPSCDMHSHSTTCTGHTGPKRISKPFTIATNRRAPSFTRSTISPKRDLSMTNALSMTGAPTNMKKASHMSFNQRRSPSWWLSLAADSWSPATPRRPCYQPSAPIPPEPTQSDPRCTRAWSQAENPEYTTICPSTEVQPRWWFLLRSDDFEQ